MGHKREFKVLLFKPSSDHNSHEKAAGSSTATKAGPDGIPFLISRETRPPLLPRCWPVSRRAYRIMDGWGMLPQLTPNVSPAQRVEELGEMLAVPLAVTDL